MKFSEQEIKVLKSFVKNTIYDMKIEESIDFLKEHYINKYLDELSVEKMIDIIKDYDHMEKGDIEYVIRSQAEFESRTK